MTLTKHALAIAISFTMGATAYAAEDMKSGMGQQQPGAQTEAGQERQGMMTAQPAPDQPLMYKSADDIIGMNVKNQNDEDIGSVDNVVVDPDTNELYAVVSVGGVLGIGDRKVPMELSQLELRDESLISRTQLSEDELKNRPKYIATNYRELEGDRVLRDVAAVGPAGGESSQQFAQLDTNGDGVISQQEAQQSDTLQNKWQRADINNDQQIDRVEFSAFEEREKQHGDYKQSGQKEQQGQQ